MVLEWGDIQESKNPDTPKYYLVFWSNEKSFLESLSQKVVTMGTRCESCNGEVTPSGNEYLCLSGCGHVKGKMI